MLVIVETFMDIKFDSCFVKQELLENVAFCFPNWCMNPLFFSFFYLPMVWFSHCLQCLHA